MKRIGVTFGLIAGAVLSAMMLLTTPFIDRLGFQTAEIVGYTSMVVAFLLVFFGIRSYRDTVLDGTIGFGKALQVGAFITAIASVCYVATWQVVYYKMAPDFAEKYAAHTLEKAKAAGATQQELDAKARDMARFQELYKNPMSNAAITFVEPLPVGLVITLVSAGFLSRRRRRGEPTTQPVKRVSAAT
ncbi:MAG: DUF4199 domain-containing protein [Gemmatimonadaceae bacterium]